MFPTDKPDPNRYCPDCDRWSPPRPPRCQHCNAPTIDRPDEVEAEVESEE